MLAAFSTPALNGGRAIFETDVIKAGVNRASNIRYFFFIFSFRQVKNDEFLSWVGMVDSLTVENTSFFLF